MSKRIEESESVGGLREVARRSWRAFFMASSLLKLEIEKAANTKGGNPVLEFDTLYTLEQAPQEGLNLRELTGSLTISHSGLSRLLDRLEARHEIERCCDENDKRAVRVRLTQRGQEVLDAQWAIFAECIQEVFGKVLTDEEHREMMILCTKVLRPAVARREKETKVPFRHRIEDPI